MKAAEVLKMLGDDSRLRIAMLLDNRDMCVCEIETILQISQSNVSRHLQKMKSIGMIGSHRDGRWIHYWLNRDFLGEFPSLLKALKELTGHETILQIDQTRFESYRSQGFSCQDLTVDKERVQSRLPH